MNIKCFMVKDFGDLWNEDGSLNVGAMVHREHSTEFFHGRDEQPHLIVVTPAGMWCVDCPESDPPHGLWNKIGEPPNLTCTPSININQGQWHGWLRDGELISV